MAVRFTYLSKTPVTTAMLAGMLARLKSTFSSYEDDLADGPVKTFININVGKALPVITLPEGIREIGIVVTGHVDAKADPYPIYHEVLERAIPTFARYGDVDVYADFIDARYLDKSAHTGEFTAGSIKGGCWFTYMPCSEIASQGVDALYNEFTTTAEQLELPLRFEKTAWGGYLVHHTTGGRLAYPLSTEVSPHTIACELPGATIDDLLQLMQKGLTLRSLSGMLKPLWTASLSQKFEPLPITGSLYQAIYDAHLPAKRYELIAEYVISDITGLDALRQISVGKRGFTTEIGGYRTPESDIGVALCVITNADGHRLRLRTTNPLDDDDLTEIRAVLRMEFVWEK